MGLDMYLYEREYVSPYMNEERYNDLVDATGKGKKTDEVENKYDLPHPRPSFVTYEVGYWRKANHIHKWFVDNVQNGVDDCGTYPVSSDQLRELRRVCEEVLALAEVSEGEVITGYILDSDDDGNLTRTATKEKGMVVTNGQQIEDLLPVASGFFFGSTEYDEYYLDDVRNTIEIIDNALNTDDSFPAFEYHSSW